MYALGVTLKQLVGPSSAAPARNLWLSWRQAMGRIEKDLTYVRPPNVCDLMHRVITARAAHCSLTGRPERFVQELLSVEPVQRPTGARARGHGMRTAVDRARDAQRRC